MAKINGEIDLSQVSKENFNPDLGIKAAVVREGAVLGSTIIKTGSSPQRQIPFEIEFNPPILPGARFPCPIIHLIGPTVSDRELLGIETVRMEVDLAPKEQSGKAKSAATHAATHSVGKISVSPEIYYCWIFCCHTYTITGRVVCRHWH